MSFKLNWYGDQMFEDISKEVDLALEKCGLHIKNKSSNQAPVDTGDLRGNCSVVTNTKIVSSPNTLSPEGMVPIDRPVQDKTVRIGYSLPYALIQHENMQFKHPMGGKAKYLEDPFRSEMPACTRLIKQAVAKGISKTIPMDGD